MPETLFIKRLRYFFIRPLREKVGRILSSASWRLRSGKPQIIHLFFLKK